MYYMDKDNKWNMHKKLLVIKFWNYLLNEINPLFFYNIINFFKNKKLNFMNNNIVKKR